MGKRAFFLAAGGLLLTVLHASAETRWAESRAEVDEIVADTTTVAPASALTPLLARTPFDNFRYPHVDAQGTITFIADDEFYGSKGLKPRHLPLGGRQGAGLPRAQRRGADPRRH